MCVFACFLSIYYDFVSNRVHRHGLVMGDDIKDGYILLTCFFGGEYPYPLDSCEPIFEGKAGSNVRKWLFLQKLFQASIFEKASKEFQTLETYSENFNLEKLFPRAMRKRQCASPPLVSYWIYRIQTGSAMRDMEYVTDKVTLRPFLANHHSTPIVNRQPKCISIEYTISIHSKRMHKFNTPKQSNKCILRSNINVGRNAGEKNHFAFGTNEKILPAKKLHVR